MIWNSNKSTSSEERRALLEKSRMYAERELRREHRRCSLFFVHPRAQWIVRLHTTFIPLIAIVLLITLIVTGFTVVERLFGLHTNELADTICKEPNFMTYIIGWAFFMFVVLGFLLCVNLASLIFSPVYFLGYYFGCITFQEATALIKDPWECKFLCWTYCVETTTPQYVCPQDEITTP